MFLKKSMNPVNRTWLIYIWLFDYNNARPLLMFIICYFSVVSNAWLETLLTSIDFLPKDVIKREVIICNKVCFFSFAKDNVLITFKVVRLCYFSKAFCNPKERCVIFYTFLSKYVDLFTGPWYCHLQGSAFPASKL